MKIANGEEVLVSEGNEEEGEDPKDGGRDSGRQRKKDFFFMHFNSNNLLKYYRNTLNTCNFICFKKN